VILFFWRDMNIINFSFFFNVTFTFSVTQYGEPNVKLGYGLQHNMAKHCFVKQETSRTVNAHADFR